MTYSQTVPASMTHEEAVARSRSLVPLIREQATTSEALRRQPESTIQAFVDAGFARFLQPKRWGGYELSFQTLLDTVLEIAKEDASAGWCASFLTIHSWFMALFSDAAQHDVWATNPDAKIATSLAPVGRFTSTENGYILNGRWAWSSGVDYCDWNMLAAMPAAMDGPPRIFILPKSDYTILDTWFVTGQKATGSNDVVVENVFIPEHRSMIMPALIRGFTSKQSLNTGPLYTLPLLAAFPIALTAPILGATIGAYETWKETSRTKYTGLSHELVSSFSHQSIRLAEIASEIDAAHTLLRSNLEVVKNGGPISTHAYARNRRNYAYVARICIRAVEQLYTNSGGSANYETHPMQRYWRDVHAMGVHAALNFDTAGEAFGRKELELANNPHDAFDL